MTCWHRLVIVPFKVWLWKHIFLVVDQRNFDCKLKCLGVMMCLWIMHTCICISIYLYVFPSLCQIDRWSQEWLEGIVIQIAILIPVLVGEVGINQLKTMLKSKYTGRMSLDWEHQIELVIKRLWGKMTTEPKISTTSKGMFRFWEALFFLISAS